MPETRLARKRLRPVAVTAALLGFGAGLGISTLQSAEGRRVLPIAGELSPLETLGPMRAMPRTALILAMEEARGHLAANRPWAAWDALRSHVRSPGDAAPAGVLLAARAAAGWGGWNHVRDLLRGRPWLSLQEGGEGWMLLAKAEEDAGSAEKAAAAYEQYLALASGSERGIAAARLGNVLRESGDSRRAATAFATAARDLPTIADWLLALRTEAMLEAGGVAPPSAWTRPAGTSVAARVRWVRAETEALKRAGNTAGAIQRLEREAGLLAAQGARDEAAELVITRARLLDSAGRIGEARDLLRSVAWESTLSPATRRRAAEMLGEVVSNATAAEELARAAAYEAAGRPGLAARSLRGALSAGALDTAVLRFRLGKLLFEAADYGPARSALLDAATRLGDPEQAAEAELLAARARYRAGKRTEGLAELRTLTERRPATAAAGSALFLLGDATSNRAQAIGLYRRAAAVRHSPDAREALFRLGDRNLKAGDNAAAIGAWEEYVAHYPRGEESAEIAFLAGRLHEQGSREARARAMYRAATLADPLSYYAFRAGERLGVDPLAPALNEPHPWAGLAGDPADAAAVLQRLDLLREAGLDAEWEDELDAALRRMDNRPAVLLAIAEGLRDRGAPLEAIRLGRRLLERRGGEWDERLLRVVFPLPYRDILEAEAERAEVDPMLLAGLVRQESTFRKDVRSRVGATGLAQIMPSTGRWLARGARMYGYEEQLLTVPEVNLRLGARYLADLVDRYDGARDLALAGYNAGPSRADRWRRELGHAMDVDRFRERIPFAETRHYVKIVLRNAAVYRRLYGDPRDPGLVEVE